MDGDHGLLVGKMRVIPKGLKILAGGKEGHCGVAVVPDATPG